MEKPAAARSGSRCSGWVDSCRARGERRLHRPRRPKGTEDLDPCDGREGELGRNVIGDRGQPKNAQLHHPASVPELLEVVTTVVLDAENQLASGHGPVDSVRTAF